MALRLVLFVQNEAMNSNAGIPSFSLYGEAEQARLELLHIEDVQSRSRQYAWEINAHRHQGLYQVLWLERGQAEVRLDTWSGWAAAPAMVVIPPGVVHGFRFEPETQGQVLTLSARFLVEGEFEHTGEAVRALFAEPRVLPLQADDAAVARLRGLWAELAAEFQWPGSDRLPVSTWLARAVVWRLAQLLAQPSPQVQTAAAGHHQAQFTRFVLLVEQHFTEHWPMARYASRLGLSVPRLNRLVQAAAGRNALDFVHDRLTREACRRLVYVAVPVTNLAQELGFDDPAYFCRFFRRRTGHSPQAYRQLNR